MIEERLPPSVKRQWTLKLSDDDLSMDSNKFPEVLEFLLKYKRAMEYESMDIRTPVGHTKGTNHHVHFEDERFRGSKFNVCL